MSTIDADTDQATATGLDLDVGRTSDEQDTTTKVTVEKARKRQGPTAMQPLRRPPDDCPEEEWVAYRKERIRRKIIKRERRGRIARRESPHDVKACAICSSIVANDQVDTSASEIAKRSMVSVSQVYRVLQKYGKKDVRGHRTLRTLRRIAHDGMGISLDELAKLVLD